MIIRIEAGRVQHFLAEGLASLPPRLRGKFETEFVTGLAQALGSVAMKPWYHSLIGGLSKGFFKGVGTALAFVLMFVLLVFMFKDVPISVLRLVLGTRGMLLSVPIRREDEIGTSGSDHTLRQPNNVPVERGGTLFT